MDANLTEPLDVQAAAHTDVQAAALVAAVVAAVASRRPVDARERESQRVFADAVATLDRPFDEHASRVHVTASALVTSDRGVVLHRHKRLGLWLQPGGHIDAGETPWDAALREAVEETGLPVSFVGGEPRLIHVDVHPGPRGHTHLDVRYHLESPYQSPSPAEGESQDVQWFAWHRAVAMADAGLEGVLRVLQPGAPVVRAARGNDAGDCAHVYLRSRSFAMPEVPCPYNVGEVRRWMADEVLGHFEVSVAELDGTIVGLMVLDPGRRGEGWIEQLYLDPAWMGRGVGDTFIAKAKQRFGGGLDLWCFEVNEGARRFFERHGFVAVDRTDGVANAERAPDIRYRWVP